MFVLLKAPPQSRLTGAGEPLPASLRQNTEFQRIEPGRSSFVAVLDVLPLQFVIDDGRELARRERARLQMDSIAEIVNAP